MLPSAGTFAPLCRITWGCQTCKAVSVYWSSWVLSQEPGSSRTGSSTASVGLRSPKPQGQQEDRVCHMVIEIGWGLCFCHSHIQGALVKMYSEHPKSENDEAETVLAPGLSFPTLFVSSWAFNADTLQVQVPVAFLLLCKRNIHSRPVAVKGTSPIGVLPTACGHSSAGSAPEGCSDHKAIRELG